MYSKFIRVEKYLIQMLDDIIWEISNQLQT